MRGDALGLDVIVHHRVYILQGIRISPIHLIKGSCV